MQRASRNRKDDMLAPEAFLSFGRNETPSSIELQGGGELLCENKLSFNRKRWIKMCGFFPVFFNSYRSESAEDTFLF